MQPTTSHPMRVVIAGGGLAGQRCAEALRRLGHDGPITIACAEPLAPYDRPPLSKAALAGEHDRAALALRPADWYARRRVELLLGRPAAALDPGRRRVVLADGAELAYDRLLVATGARPRTPALFAGAPNAHVLRTHADACRLRAALVPGARLVVVGAGFIGLEVAAAARALGVEVTVLEALATPLAGVLGPAAGAWFAELHRARGVAVRCGAPATDVRRDAAGRITAVVLPDGRALACDAVVAGTGVAPDDGWLAGSGLPGAGGGVACDAGGRTALDGVLAAGDVARAYDPVAEDLVRTEHWEAAARQGVAAARAMLGLPTAPAPPASFWSDQHGVRIQHLGHVRPEDDVELDGDPAAAELTAVWRREGRPVAALVAGRPRELPRLRRLLQETYDRHDPEEIAA